jgi:hypothetical protein
MGVMFLPEREIARAGMKILVLGNCQVHGLAQCLQVMIPEASVVARFLTLDALADIGEFDDIFLQTRRANSAVQAAVYDTAVARAGDRIIRWPTFFYSGFHPDLVYAFAGGELVHTPLGHYNSALAIFGWKNALTVKQTMGLFCEPVFEYLSYFSHARLSARELDTNCTDIGVDLPPLLTKWSDQGCFAYSINHPKLFVLSDLAQSICERLRFPMSVREPFRFLQDDLLNGPIWPVYPEIARRFEIVGSYDFKAPTSPQGVVTILSLEEFISRSFEQYATLSHPITTERFSDQEEAACLKDFALAGKASLSKPDAARQQRGIAAELQRGTGIVCEEDYLDAGN